MSIYRGARRRHVLQILGLAAAGLMIFAFSLPQWVLAQNTSRSARSIAVMVSSDHNSCFTPGVVAAIRHFTAAQAQRINASGGVAGRELKLIYFDDFEDATKTAANVEAAIANDDLIAMIGISSSTRGKAVIDQIGRHGVPLVSEMSRDDFFAPYNNAFSIAPAVSDEIAAVQKFATHNGFKRPAFIGFEGDLYSERYSRALTGDGTADENVTPVNQPGRRAHWLPRKPNFALDEDAVDAAIAGIAQQGADILFMAIHSGPGSKFLRKLSAAGVQVPVFIILGRIGRIERLLASSPYGADMYELAREGIPNVYNERLQQHIWKTPGQRWIFDDTRTPGAPESCKKFVDPEPISNVRNRENRRAIGRGVQYGDILSIMAMAGNEAGEGATSIEVRTAIVAGLNSLREHQRMQRGLWQDWTFTSARSVAEDVLIAFRPAGSKAISLAPIQYRRSPTGLIPTPVVYIGVDMVRINRVDSNEKTFHAEFYLSLRSESTLQLDDIEFTNAFRSPLSNEPVISTRQITGGEAVDGNLKLYKIIGKFTFDPELDRYPFDRQRFSISFQPTSTARPFFIQPPPPEVRKKTFLTDGWRILSEYIGADHDIISVIAQQAGALNIIPLIRFNYTWTMKRVTTNYYLQVVAPLVVILIVTYLSVFIPQQRLESVVAIQVTALLSSIALYLAIPKVQYDHATTSDVVFVATYLIISLMLGLSILRVNSAGAGSKYLPRAVKGFQILVLPILVIAMVDYVVAQNTTVGSSVLQTLWQKLAQIIGYA